MPERAFPVVYARDVERSVRFYRELRAGRLGYDRAAVFTSYPRLLGVALHDDGAEEAFWVYDHPRVEIYERTRALSWPWFRRALCGGAVLPGCGRSR